MNTRDASASKNIYTKHIPPHSHLKQIKVNATDWIGGSNANEAKFKDMSACVVDILINNRSIIEGNRTCCDAIPRSCVARSPLWFCWKASAMLTLSGGFVPSLLGLLNPQSGSEIIII